MRFASRASLIRGTWVALAWTAVGVFAMAQGYASAFARGVDPTPWLPWGPLFSVWFWVPLTPAVWWLTRRFPIDRTRWPVSLAAHAGASGLISLLDAAADRVFITLVLELPAPSFAAHFAADLWVNTFSYCVLVVILHAMDFRTMYREEHATAEELSSRLAQAQLQALRAHLHPHFLFNSINAAAELVHESPESADRMLTRLGLLLQRAFAGSGIPTVPLETELSFAEDYLEIARIRFADRLTYRIHATRRARQAMVPSFLLQPILENAVRHGIEVTPRGGSILVNATCDGPTLDLSVSDTGAGFGDGRPTGRGGRGLEMTRRLLEHVSWGTASLHIDSRHGAGTHVSIRLPIQVAEGGES